MGIVIRKGSQDAKQSFFRLVLDCSGEPCPEAVSVGNQIALQLIETAPHMRSMSLEKCLLQVVSILPEDSIIKDIDVLFNPSYSVDVLKILINVYRKHRFQLIWPGTCEDGCLAYAEEGFEDYKTYDINEYDIVCLK